MANLGHTMAQLAVTATCFLGACGSESPFAKPATSASLEGRAFTLVESREFSPIQAGRGMLLYFRDGEVGLNAGCNAQFGAYDLVEGRLVVPELGSTAKDCEAALAAQDEWLSTFLMQEPTVTLSGDRITLDGEVATLTFVEEL